MSHDCAFLPAATAKKFEAPNFLELRRTPLKKPFAVAL